MLEREAKRRYLTEMAIVMALYIGTLTIAIRVGRGMDEGLLKTLLTLLPAIPVFLTVWVIARQFARADEFVRLRSLESIAIAAGVTAGLTFTYGFLENVGFPRLSMFWVWGVMGLTWGAHACLRCLWSR
ncbi:MAG TPA: hypothetical protein VM146_00585 [Steroidobacteraceae bacterium]|nr:hypothetical protein [Steroidobacteraceae bacterium]